MLKCEDGSSLDLLAMKVNHLINLTVLVLMVEDVSICLLLFEFELSAPFVQIIRHHHFGLLVAGPLCVPVLQLSGVDFLLGFLEWLDPELMVFFSDRTCLVIDLEEISDQFLWPHVAPVDVLVFVRLAFQTTNDDLF